MVDTASLITSALQGRYRIERRLGEGGMASVFLAEDLKHGRKVALKVLKPELAAVVGAARFLAEIKTTANLQHPHILPLHDSGEADGLLFYVMPFVSGESLRSRLDREHQLPVDEAVRIATSMAEALDYAHRQGVVHRDIKPANVLLQDGEPVISDFGIALAVSAGGRTRLTETGLSPGTPHYMSPEQAGGERHVGPAADTYSVGCVLYEMLAGEPPYTGRTLQAILGRIITEDAPSIARQRKVPENVEATIRRALEKIPADRFETTGDLARALGDPSFRWGEGSGAVSGNAESWRRWAITATAAAVVLFGVLSWHLAGESGDTQDRSLRYSTMLLPEGRTVASGPRNPLSVSGDGSLLAVRTSSPEGNELWVRRWSDPAATALPIAAGSVFLSPDGQWIAFHATDEGAIKRIHLSGGLPETVGPTGIDDQFDLYGLAWGSGGEIVIATNRGLRLFPAPGAPPRDVPVVELASEDPLVMGDPRYVFRQPAFLPGGDGFLVTRTAGTVAPIRHEIVVLEEDGAATTLVEGHSPHLTSDGILIFASARGPRGSLLAVHLGEDFRSLSGTPVPVLDGVWEREQGRATSALYAISENGTLVYAPEAISNRPRLAWIDRDGGLEQLLSASSPQLPTGINVQRGLLPARLSPDGRRVAFRAIYTDEPSFRVFVYDLERGVLGPISVDLRADWPVWTPDGERLLFNRFSPDEQNVYQVRADNAAPPVPFWPENPRQQHPQVFSPDGRYIVYQERAVTDGPDSDLWLYEPSSGEARILVDGPGIEKHADVSPDGRFLAFVSDVSGRDEVYVTEFPVSRSRTKISVDEARSPVWSPRGDELFYMRSDRTIMSVRVTLSDGFEASTPTEFLSGNFHLGYAWGRAFDVSPDGSRLLVGDLTGDGAGVARLEVVDHWLLDVRRRLER